LKPWVKWVLIAVALLVGAWLADSDLPGLAEVGEVLPALFDDAFRGAQLSRGTVVNGVVQEDVGTLAAQASAVLGRPVANDAYALAKVCRSEEGRAGQMTKVYLCHVMLNQARGGDVVATIEAHNTAARDGHFGEQISGAVSSVQDPYESDLNAAEYALAQRAQGEDPTGGATNFVDKRAFGVQAGTGSFADLVARWGASGKVPGNLPDASANVVFFWAGGLPDVAEAIA